MTADLYREFLDSSLGRWLDAELRDGCDPVPRSIHNLLAHLAEAIREKRIIGEAAQEERELIDLIVFRIYNFQPDEVEATMRYLEGKQDLASVADIATATMERG